MRALWPCLLLAGCLPRSTGHELSLAEMRGQTGVTIHAHESSVFEDDGTPRAPTMTIDFDTPDCARFGEAPHVTAAGVTTGITDTKGSGVDCVQAQSNLTFPLGTFTGQPVVVEISAASDTWTIEFDGFHNGNLTMPAQVTRAAPATLTWIDGPHIANGCFRMPTSTPGFDEHGCKFDSNIRFPASPGNTLEIDVPLTAPQQATFNVDLVGEYIGGYVPVSSTAGPPRTCDGPLGCQIILAVNRSISVTVQ